MRQSLTAAALLGAALLGGTSTAQELRPVDRSITEAFEAGHLKSLHAALATIQGETLAEVYFDGPDEHRGQTLGAVRHGPDTLHDVRSITKSITALLYGIALAEGRVPRLDAPLLAQFPEYADLMSDPLRDAITISDALTMRMGTEWNENLPYTDLRNSEIAMEDSADSDRFVLDRPMVAPPGTQWSYNGGAAALIGKLIEGGSGMALDDYARDRLFHPLGITQWHWARRPDGVPSPGRAVREEDRRDG